MKELNRFDDFVSLLRCIKERILDHNISFHLTLDVGQFYGLDSIHEMRYNSTSLEWWLVIKKILKGKGINLHRAYKAPSDESDHISNPKDCRINFIVPSDPVLTREGIKYQIDAAEPGVLTHALDSFAESNGKVEVKLILK